MGNPVTHASCTSGQRTRKGRSKQSAIRGGLGSPGQVRRLDRHPFSSPLLEPRGQLGKDPLAEPADPGGLAHGVGLVEPVDHSIKGQER